MNETTNVTSKNSQPRFFTSLRFRDLSVESPLQQLNPIKQRKVATRKEKQMRYAAYLRVSSEEQVGNYSIEAQRRANITWVKAQEGVLAKTYIDEAESGRKADRPGFQEMRRDARKLRFDAVVVHKFRSEFLV